MLWTLLAAALAADPGPWEIRAALGGEFNPSSHGVADLGVRRGPWSAQLLTDTLDLRWEPEGDRGRAWVAARAEFGAAGLMISPWLNGAPAPTDALTASYAGLEGGALRYLPAGLYAGGQGWARLAWFGVPEGSLRADPYPETWVRAETVLGWWRPGGHIQAFVGLDVVIDDLEPHATLDAAWTPPWTVVPIAELRACQAEDQGLLQLSRVGGLNPYVVPLAGAGWGEWWVEDYAAARLGVAAQGGWGRVGLVVDQARVDGQNATGFGLLARGQRRLVYLDTAVGYAPWIERQDGVGRFSVWAVLGLDWWHRPLGPGSADQ